MKYIYSPCREQIKGEHNYKLLPDENWAWWGIQNLAGLSERAGFLEKTTNIPYTLDNLAYELNIPLDLITRTIDKLKLLGWLHELDEPKGIFVIDVSKWDSWQVVKIGETKDNPKRKTKTPEEREEEERKIAFKYLDEHPDVRKVIGQGQQTKKELEDKKGGTKNG